VAPNTRLLAVWRPASVLIKYSLRFEIDSLLKIHYATTRYITASTSLLTASGSILLPTKLIFFHLMYLESVQSPPYLIFSYLVIEPFYDEVL